MAGICLEAVTVHIVTGQEKTGLNILCIIFGQTFPFLGARAPLELANVKKNNNNKKIRKKFLIAITALSCFYLHPDILR